MDDQYFLNKTENTKHLKSQYKLYCLGLTWLMCMINGLVIILPFLITIFEKNIAYNKSFEIFYLPNC